MFKVKPTKCQYCNDMDVIEASVTFQAPVSDTYWYCRTCKDELDSGGWPVSKVRPVTDDIVEEFSKEELDMALDLWCMGVD